MKLVTQLATFVVAAALTTVSFAGGNSDHKPKHGGVVAIGKAFDSELVLKADSVALYLDDHGKLKSAKGASAKVTLLEAGKKTEAMLAPSADGSKLEAKGNFPTAKGTKIIAAITIDGKPSATHRFEIK
jgi:hypothetical protein